MKHALIVGGSSRVGQICIKQLLEQGYQVTYTVTRATSSKWSAPFDKKYNAHISSHILNLNRIESDDVKIWMKDFDIAIVIPPIYLAQNLLPYLIESSVKRLVFISSYNTYRFGHSAHYKPLVNAQSGILSRTNTAIIIQPTMIMGHKQSSATQLIWQRLRHGKAFYSILGKSARQQPIDFRDLARALLYSATNSDITKGCYPVAGKDVVSTKTLYTELGKTIGKKPYFIYIPSIVVNILKYISALLIPKSDIPGYISRVGHDRHLIHPSLPEWSPKYSLSDSLTNLRQELKSQT